MANKAIIEKDMKESIRFYQKCLKCKKCGHTVKMMDKEKGFCEFCGNYIFKDKRDEFMYRMRGII